MNNINGNKAYTVSKKLFGERSRYALIEFHTRFNTIEWFVDDAETPREDGTPCTVAQSASQYTALETVGYCNLGGHIVRM